MQSKRKAHKRAHTPTWYSRAGGLHPTPMSPFYRIGLNKQEWNQLLYDCLDNANKQFYDALKRLPRNDDRIFNAIPENRMPYTAMDSFLVAPKWLKELDLNYLRFESETLPKKFPNVTELVAGSLWSYWIRNNGLTRAKRKDLSTNDNIFQIKMWGSVAVSNKNVPNWDIIEPFWEEYNKQTLHKNKLPANLQKDIPDEYNTLLNNGLIYNCRDWVGTTHKSGRVPQLIQSPATQCAHLGIKPRCDTMDAPDYGTWTLKFQSGTIHSDMPSPFITKQSIEQALTERSVPVQSKQALKQLSDLMSEVVCTRENNKQKIHRNTLKNIHRIVSHRELQRKKQY